MVLAVLCEMQPHQILLSIFFMFLLVFVYFLWRNVYSHHLLVLKLGYFVFFVIEL